MAYKFNPFTGKLDNTGPSVSALNVLGTVADDTFLPGSATTGDVYQAEDTGVFYVWDGSAWDNLGTLVGPQGPTGATGPTGPAGADGTDGTDGTDGADGADGVGIPVGGTDGQALVKASNTDYDTEWADVTAVAALNDLTDVTLTSPSDGQVLEYDSATSTWVNATPSGGGGTPGGSDTQVQFNDSSTFGGDSGLTYNKTTGSLTVGGKTVTTNAPVLNLSQRWDSAGTTFTGLKLNVTNAASANGSSTIDLSIGGTSLFKHGYDFANNANTITLDTANLVHINSNGGTIVSFYGANNSQQPLNVRTAAGIGLGPLGAQTFLRSDAANTLALKWFESPQTFRIYNTVSQNNIDYERLSLKWDSNVFKIKSEAGGTGTIRGIQLGSSASEPVALFGATPVAQPTTAIGSATVAGGGGTAVDDATTFGGYTLAQVVQALKNLGILA